MTVNRFVASGFPLSSPRKDIEASGFPSRAQCASFSEVLFNMLPLQLPLKPSGRILSDVVFIESGMAAIQYL